MSGNLCISRARFWIAAFRNQLQFFSFSYGWTRVAFGIRNTPRELPLLSPLTRRIGKGPIVTGNRRQRNREIEIEIERNSDRETNISKTERERETRRSSFPITGPTETDRQQEIGKNAICIAWRER
uniref:Uncharacterized protein n=1 Tax=Noccaea caerulescens TaxID=107243 RepID=A0A1J3E846_NOCCA